MSEKTNKRILLLLPEAPKSLRDSGISIRYVPLIESIYKDCVLDALIISKEIYSEESLSLLRKYCRKVDAITHPDPTSVSWMEKIVARVNFLVPWSLPRSWVAYGANQIRKAVNKITSGENYTAIICVSGYNYPYVGAIKSEKVIVDFIDSPSVLTWRNVIGSNRSFFVQKYEFLKTVLWEAKIIRQSAASLYISTSDVKAIPGFLANKDTRHVIRNGYCADDYNDMIRDDICHPAIGFLGNMSYYPNIEAALWLYKSVFLPLKMTMPDINLYIIGRSPDKRICDLSQSPGVVVTGEVESIWSYLNSMEVLAFPILRGAGVKNKLLEAMYANKPVFTTNIGNEGIDATENDDLIICNTENEYIDAILKYLRNCDNKTCDAGNGRRFVEMNFSWDTIKDKFRSIVLGECEHN